MLGDARKFVNKKVSREIFTTYYTYMLISTVLLLTEQNPYNLVGFSLEILNDSYGIHRS